MGTPHQIASEICRFGYEQKIQANLAITSNPDSAILLAQHLPGVTLVTPGEERFELALIPVTALFSLNSQTDPNLLATLGKWGVKTCGDLTALPEKSLAELLGEPGVYLRRLAYGSVNRPLKVAPSSTNYQERLELEHPLHLLEPLLFLFGRVLTELCRRLRAQSRQPASCMHKWSSKEKRRANASWSFQCHWTRAQPYLNFSSFI